MRSDNKRERFLTDKTKHHHTVFILETLDNLQNLKHNIIRYKIIILLFY